MFSRRIGSAGVGVGKTGHRIVGEVATEYLSEPAAQAVEDILGPEGLAEASDWADYMRSNPDAFWRSEANPWHYVTIPEGMRYTETTPPEAGDAITALTKFRAIAMDEGASLEDRQLALRFIVHLVGDLQQPLHAGNGKDRGGNWVDVVFFEEMSNLHEVWDEKLIQYEELSYSEWANWLIQKITPADLGEWGKRPLRNGPMKALLFATRFIRSRKSCLMTTLIWRGRSSTSR